MADFYPKKINERFREPQNAGKPEKTNTAGTGASFICGSLVRFYLEIDERTKEIRAAKFTSNGCGFAIAAADVLTEKIVGRKLTALRGPGEIKTKIEYELGIFEATRKHCLEIALDALDQAFADFRARLVEEFAGEKALICTCFGVSEEIIERVIAETGAESVAEVGELCNAGTGCGACQMLIGELIDIYQSEN